MATSPSPAEPEKAVQKLIRVEGELHLLLSEEQFDPTKIEDKIRQQDELVEQIISHVDNSSPPARFKQLMRNFRSLREKTEELFEERMEQLKRKIESLDNSGKLIKHYMQGEKRDEEVISQRFDENV